MAKVMVFPVGTGEKRYTCNGVLEINGTPARMLDSLLKSMDGDGVYSQGVWTIWAAGPADPEADVIDESWLNGGISFKRGATKNEKVNTAGGTYINPDDYWAATGFPSVSIPAYVEEDQEELTADLSLNFCTSGFQAQRMGRLAIERSRSGMVVTYPCNLKALQVKVNEVRKVSNSLLGWDEKLFRVLDWQFSMMGGINLTLGEYNPEIYDIAVGDMQPIPTPDPTTLPDPWTVAAPTDLTATETLYATNVASMIMVRADLVWTQPTVGATLFEVEQNYGAGFFPAGQSPTEALTLWDVQPGAQQFRVRAVNGLGVKSEWSTIDVTILGKTAAPATVTGFSGFQSENSVVLSWDPVADVDLAGYAIRIGGTSWETAAIVQELVVANTCIFHYSYFSHDPVTLTFRIKAIDTSGNYSAADTTESVDFTWMYVDNADITGDTLVDNGIWSDLPASGSTKNIFSTSTTNPAGGANGDCHYNSTTKTNWIKVAGVWITTANLIGTGDVNTALIAANAVSKEYSSSLSPTQFIPNISTNYSFLAVATTGMAIGQSDQLFLTISLGGAVTAGATGTLTLNSYTTVGNYGTPTVVCSMPISDATKGIFTLTGTPGIGVQCIEAKLDVNTYRGFVLIGWRSFKR